MMPDYCWFLIRNYPKDKNVNVQAMTKIGGRYQRFRNE